LPIDDAGVIQAVRIDHVLVRFHPEALVGQGREERLICSPAGGEEDRVLGAQKLRDFLLQFEVDILRPADNRTDATP
jgi:hypothetical protein